MDIEELRAALNLTRARPAKDAPAPKVVIENDVAIATSPEGKTARMPVATLLAKLTAGRMSTGPAILPAGIKSICSQGGVTIWIWESGPRVHNFSWIANDSPKPYGPGAKYRQVTLALPYVLIFAVFGVGESGLPQLLQNNECFFRTAPLKDLNDELFYPALLNCSKIMPIEGRPLSWICTQHLQPTPKMASTNLAERFCAGFEALRHCLLETAFNLSSDRHEAASWFTESQKIDPRIHDVEAWQKASAKDPLFVLDVPWLKTGFSVKQVADRIFQNHQSRPGRITSVEGLARIIFNHK
jgi:hypothetical protein